MQNIDQKIHQKIHKNIQQNIQQENYKILDVELQPAYPIYISQDIYANSDLLQKHISAKCTQILIVSNQIIAPLYLNKLQNNLNNLNNIKLNIKTCILQDGEDHKDFTQLEVILNALLQARFDRHCCLIALGGGVIGDITGFAASIYLRGVDFIQIPTTLLSQVDSSIGGKTAINHALGKNMIGAFWQPKAVLTDVALLASLPPRIFALGLAEMIKHGLIFDQTYIEFLEQNVEKIKAQDPEILAQAIYLACQIKAKIVEQDEKEQGMRAFLNLGHTFGHAVEAGMGYGTYLHGEAVAIGMVWALKWSVQNNGLDVQILNRTVDLLQAFDLPTENPSGMHAKTYLEYMQSDKKNAQGRINLITLKDISSPSIEAVEASNLLAFFEKNGL